MASVHISNQKKSDSKSPSVVSPAASIAVDQKKLDESFHHAVFNLDYKAVELIIKKVSDVNVREEVSGRTALHLVFLKLASNEAYFNESVKMIQLLFLNKAIIDVEDNAGYTPYDLYVNPHVYDEKNSNQNLIHLNPLNDFFIEQVNTKLAEQKNTGKMVYAKNIKDIEEYLQKNPNLSRISFIIRKPACCRYADEMDTHSMGIYFEKKGNIEYFIQLDSQSQVVLLPDSSDPNITRKFFYFDMQRQVSYVGCFEDAVILGMKFLKNESLIPFIETHSEKTKIYFTDDDIQKHNALSKQKENGNPLSDEEEKFLLSCIRRDNIGLQLKLFEISNLTFKSDVYNILIWHPILIPHVENYRTMRMLRCNPKQISYFTQPSPTAKNELLIDSILKSGSKRYSTAAEIKANLSNPDKKYDFNGRNFEDRHMDFEFSYHKACTANIFLFKKKLREKNKGLEKQAISESKVNATVALVEKYLI